jgi:hypothetical protein
VLDEEGRFVIEDLHRKSLSVSEMAHRTGREPKTVRRMITGPLEPEGKRVRAPVRAVSIGRQAFELPSQFQRNLWLVCEVRARVPCCPLGTERGAMPKPQLRGRA